MHISLQARGHDDWDDDMCLVCGGYMTEWTGAAPSQPVGYCSWCYRESTQQYIQVTAACLPASDAVGPASFLDILRK
jgi:hypothetical protein